MSDKKGLPLFLGDKDRYGEVTASSAHRRLIRTGERRKCHCCGKTLDKPGESVLVCKPESPHVWCVECW